MSNTRFDGQDYDLGGIQSASLMDWMGEADGPASYATGGFALASVDADLTGYVLKGVMCTPDIANDLVFVADVANNKIKCLVPSTGAEVAAATDLSNVKLHTWIRYTKQ